MRWRTATLAGSLTGKFDSPLVIRFTHAATDATTSSLVNSLIDTNSSGMGLQANGVAAQHSLASSRTGTESGLHGNNGRPSNIRCKMLRHTSQFGVN